MNERVLLTSRDISLTITRLCHQLLEIHSDFSSSVLIGIQPRGTYLSDRIFSELKSITGREIQYGKLDVTFYRDDFRRREEVLIPSSTEMDFLVEDKKVILIDDVLYTGRTIRAAMDALMDFGRPSSVELLTLIDRRFSRDLPIQPNYVGRTVDSIASEKVKVCWVPEEDSDKVILFTQKNLPDEA